MSWSTAYTADEVHYRIGSLERRYCRQGCRRCVHYRIGSLENRSDELFSPPRVHYRIGSLEKQCRCASR